MRLVQIALAISAVVLAPLPVLAAPRDAVMNKEGFWAVDVDHGACAASMTLQGGVVFLLRAQDGKVTFALVDIRKSVPRGKVGRIQTDIDGFDFKPSYGEGAQTLFYDGEFDARALAVLRQGREARILIDGKTVAAMTLEGTGFEGALDAAVACSNGQSGWWGKGVGPAPASSGEEDIPLNKEGFWSLVVAEDSCSSVLRVEGGFGFVLIATNGGRDVMLGAGSDAGFKRGRKGTLKTHDYSFAFKPEVNDDRTYLQLDKFMDSQTLFTLRRARTLTIDIDGKEAIGADVAETGLVQLVDDLMACGAGKSGWWGDGAASR